ncbi:MAG: TonB-dependent receptor [Bacteroidia bacterium]|nr:TonB-dependent receptor [Bacteroidia bacterium]
MHRFSLWGLVGVMLSQVITGTVYDAATGEALPGASVRIQGTNVGTLTDEKGAFSLPLKAKLPVFLIVTYIGYDTAKVPVSSFKPLRIALGEKEVLQQTVEIVDIRISQKQQESPLTIETMDAIAVRESPSPDFYENLANLKGVDITTASLGFKIINTRGFNSTRPVRTLQIIDGMDNQAPGLNFSLGNFVGASELDIQSVELVVGAQSALYGPNAFNGVILMHLKDPFLHQGTSVSFKVGNRRLIETNFRLAQVVGAAERFAFKLSGSFMQAQDWPADNADPTEQSLVGKDNPGGYDAVNRYGDENPDPRSNNYDNSDYSRFFFPGLGIYHRTGYWERELVDYTVKSFKLSGGLYYKLTPDLRAEYTANFGTGTTVYQGDNRYSIRDILFFQQKVELKGKNFYLRAYYTTEDAGKSYDIVFTALLLQNYAKPSSRWALDYQAAFLPYSQRIRQDPDFPSSFVNNPNFYTQYQQVLAKYRDSLYVWHEIARAFADSQGNPFFCDTCRNRLEPGTPEFNAVFQRIISNPSFLGGGSRFVDNSSLYHIQGGHEWTFGERFHLHWGANYRKYLPRSFGTIFADTLIDPTRPELGYRRITLYEWGAFAHLESRWLKEDRLRIGLALRADVQQNYVRERNILQRFSLEKMRRALRENFIYSPALTATYDLKRFHTLRIAYTSALRYPTLQDQYLYYNVGRAILRGNFEGMGNIIPLENLYDYLATGDQRLLEPIFVPGVRPERLRTLEVGYKGIWKERLFIDAGYFFSWYWNFLGFRLVSTVPDLLTGRPVQIYRLSANASDIVTTQGFALGLYYYFAKKYTFSGNYTWAVLNRGGAWMNDIARQVNRLGGRRILREIPPHDDPIIPAFNTPPHKYGLGLSARDLIIPIGGRDIRYIGFAVTWRWIHGFRFEGSPQFTGYVPSYGTLDGQISWRPASTPEITYKLGGTNLTGQRFFQAYGAPFIGRLVYIGVWIDLL